MSITLSVPPAVVQEVREWAAANGTSLNAYIRECLEAKCREINARQARKAKEFIEFMKNLPPCNVTKGWKFDRERDGHREIKIRVGA